MDFLFKEVVEDRESHSALWEPSGVVMKSRTRRMERGSRERWIWELLKRGRVGDVERERRKRECDWQ